MKKILIMIATLLSCVLIFAGCSGNKYHAVLYDNAGDWIDDEFLDKNRVYAYYPNKDYVEGVSPWGESQTIDKTLPGEKTFIITEQSEFDSIFTKCDLSVDFEKQMVVLVISSDIYGCRKYFLDKVTIKENTLNVYINLEQKDRKDATMPFARCFVIILDKVEFETVKLIKQY